LVLNFNAGDDFSSLERRDRVDHLLCWGVVSTVHFTTNNREIGM
jgi:hypothetical protein